VPAPTKLQSLGLRLLSSLLGAALALGLAFAAAHFYSAPTLNGAARGSSWLERDFCFAAASGVVAIAVGLYADGARLRGRVQSAVLVRTLLWFGLTILLGVAWATSVSLLTLLIAPSHAFAGLRLAALVREWRSERLWQS